jgi:predicted RNase H-like HicB family nuclease
LWHVLNQETLQVRVWQEDGGYIAECLDIPGCMSQGETRSEAIANILDAISGCLDVIAEDAGVVRGGTIPPETIELPMTAVVQARP